jgi:hypothetical protein
MRGEIGVLVAFLPDVRKKGDNRDPTPSLLGLRHASTASSRLLSCGPPESPSPGSTAVSKPPACIAFIAVFMPSAMTD